MLSAEPPCRSQNKPFVRHTIRRNELVHQAIVTIRRSELVQQAIVRRPAHPRRLVGVLVIGRVAAKRQAQLASAPEGSVILSLSLGDIGKLISAPRPKVTAAERQVDRSKRLILISYLVALPSSRKEFTPTAIIRIAMFDFPRISIVEALAICIASLKRASNPRQVFQQFAKLIVSYSYGSSRDLYRRIIHFLKLLGDPSMSAVRPPRIVKFLFCVRCPCCQEQRGDTDDSDLLHLSAVVGAIKFSQSTKTVNRRAAHRHLLPFTERSHA
jgi:hypothetical protein